MAMLPLVRVTIRCFSQCIRELECFTSCVPTAPCLGEVAVRALEESSETVLAMTAPQPSSKAFFMTA